MIAKGERTMNREEQFQKEYQLALNQMVFSADAKQRFIKAMLDMPEVTRSRRLTPISVLIVAAVFATLTLTAAAAAVWRNQVRIVHSPEEAVQLEQSSQNAIILGTYDGDWEYHPPTELVTLWWDELQAQGAEEIQGTAQDGWNVKQILQKSGETKARYLGDSLSAFDGIWQGMSLNTGWLEKQYVPVEGAQTCYTNQQGRELQEFELIGAYKSKDGGTAFTLEYHRHSATLGNQYILSESYENAETYVTADGAETVISTGLSKSGEPLVWVNLVIGRDSFNLVGTQMKLEDVYALLDSLGLATIGTVK